MKMKMADLQQLIEGFAQPSLLFYICCRGQIIKQTHAQTQPPIHGPIPTYALCILL
jgi:hypothetical protein